MFPETLSGSGLQLRAVAPADASALFAYLSRPEVYLSTSADPWTFDAVEQFVADSAAGLQSGQWCRYGIVIPGESGPAGTVGLFDVDLRNRRCEIGYDLAPEYWGGGLATRAASLLLGWAFANAFHRVEATVMAGNTRSERVLQRLGFELEATMRDYKLVRGEFRDYSLWALLAPGPA